MTATAVDTSVLIAALCSWHEHHERALQALTAVARDGELIVPAPALVEAYSVMTRLPSPHRLSPKDARAILSRSFEKKASIVGLTGSETWRLIRDTAASGVAGGRTYDATILACARKAGADRLLTLDLRDFRRLEVDDIELLGP